jgi:hypothetical protein
MYKYCKILLPILLFALTATAQTPVSTTVLTATNIAALQSYKGGLTVAHITDTMRGGWFRLTPKGSTVIDSGVNLYCANTAYVWKRDVSQSRAYNIRWFGGIGGGITTYKQDSAAITDAIRFLKTLHGNTSLYFPGTNQYYGFNGNGVSLPSNIEIFGDGVNSQIKHVNPSGATYLKGCIFFLTSYRTQTQSGILKPGMANYPIYDAAKFQKYIRLQNIADTVHFPVDKFFGIGARIFGKGFTDDTSRLRYSEFEMNRCIRISGDTIFLKYYTSVQFESDSLPPVMIDLNSGLTTNNLNGEPDFATENVHVHDLTLSQASYNLIDGTPYVGQTPYNVLGSGGTFESVFEGLHLDGYGTFGGNLYNRCEIRNITISSGKKMLDFGYCSANCNVHDITWNYNNNISDTTSKSLIFLDDGTHDMNLYNISASGAYDGNNILQFGAPTFNINIHNSRFDFPNYNGSAKAPIQMTDKLEWTVNDITLNDIIFNIDKAQSWIRVEGVDSISNRNLRFSNLKFYGQAPYNKSKSVYLNYAGNIQLRDVYFAAGDTMFMYRCDSAKLTNVSGGNMYMSIAPDVKMVTTRYSFMNNVDFVPVKDTAAYTFHKQGRITFNASDNTYYGDNGLAWIPLMGGGGSVTSVAKGYGIKADGTITTTGTITVDTLVMSTRAWRDKLGDSLNTNIALKLNKSDTAAMMSNALRNVYRKLGSDSVFIVTASGAIYSYKDSLGVTSIATTSNTGIKGGTITTSGTLYIDTTILTTRAWRDKLADSINATKTKVITIFTASVNSTVAAATTVYGSIGSTNFTSGENAKGIIITDAGILRNFYINTRNVMPSTGTLTITIRKNGADTPLQIVLAISSAAAVYSDLTHSTSVSAGDIITFSLVNASATDVSAAVVGFSFGYYKN